MNDLDTRALRQALRTPADPDFAAGAQVDVTRIMARGRRLRQRRRLAVVAGGLCAVAVLGGAATAIANVTDASSGGLQPAGPVRPGPAVQQPSPSSRIPLPSPQRRNGGITPTPSATATPPMTWPTPTSSPWVRPTATNAPAPSTSPTAASSPSASATTSVPSTETVSPSSLASVTPTPTRAPTTTPATPATPAAAVTR